MNIKIAIPAKGRMREPSIRLLESAGIKLRESEERSLFIRTNRPEIDVISVRTEDIPEFVENGAVELGITGQDMVAEAGVNVAELLPLNYGSCSLILAVPEKSEIKSVKDLKDCMKVATKFENIAKNFLKKNGKKAEVITLSGSLEIAPLLGLAEAIVDLTSTGTTLRTHGLKIVDTILDSQAVFIGNKEAMKEAGKKAIIDDIMLALQGVVSAEKKKYLMVNLPEGKLPELERVCGGMLSPTITKLDKEGWISAQMVVEEKGIFDMVKKIKGIGGRDILVLPIERMVL